MESEGLVGVIRDMVSSDRLADTKGWLPLTDWLEYLLGKMLMSERGASGSMQMDELSKHEHQADTDVTSGYYVRYDVYVPLGFKPK